MDESQKPQKYTRAHGRRKEASARARLFKGKGSITINGKLSNEYFSGNVEQAKLERLLNLVKNSGDFYMSITVKGSGRVSQLDAVMHSIARVYVAQIPELKQTLRKAGFITRDPRVKERRKFGMAQKARKGKQSPKR